MNEEVTPSKNSRSLFKTILFVLVCIGILGGIFWVWQMQKPKQGTIRKAPEQTSSATTVAKEKMRIEGEYLSFSALATYTPVVETDEAKRIKESTESTFLQTHYLVSYSSTSSKKVAVSVERLPSGVLTDNASFLFRVSSPKLYTQSKVEIGEQSFTLFTRSEDIHEVTVFMPHNGLVASVALTSGNVDLETLKDELLAVSSSIVWK